MNGIILDFRNNRGGVLRDAISIADLFIQDGRILLTKGRHPRSIKEFTAQSPDIAIGMPLIVLIKTTRLQHLKLSPVLCRIAVELS